jgi:hypothetical protein
MAMKIGSKYKFSEIQARHWDQLAEGVRTCQGAGEKANPGVGESRCQPRRAQTPIRLRGTALQVMPWSSDIVALD